MSDTEFEEFFRSMASRFRNENHLSDLTFTALELIPSFKMDFVRFFFEDLPSTAEDAIWITRESSLESGDGRPDLVFHGKDWDLVIENKLWDQNYHFDQYGKVPLFPHRTSPPRVGLIANHRITLPAAVSSWQMRTWSDFVEVFEKKEYVAYNRVFRAYLAYVRKICKMTEFKTFQFHPDSLFALTDFVRMTERAMRAASTDRPEIRFNHKKGNFGESWAGYSFDLMLQQRNERLSLFFGIDFSFAPQPPAVGVHIHKYENPLHFQRVWDAIDHTPDFKLRRELQDGMLQLNMHGPQFGVVNEEENREKQFDHLKKFLMACCDELLRIA
jgi:hypothetical protein